MNHAKIVQELAKMRADAVRLAALVDETATKCLSMAILADETAERVLTLQARVAAIEAKRQPGRPRKASP